MACAGVTWPSFREVLTARNENWILITRGVLLSPSFSSLNLAFWRQDFSSHSPQLSLQEHEGCAMLTTSKAEQGRSQAHFCKEQVASSVQRSKPCRINPVQKKVCFSQLQKVVWSAKTDQNPVSQWNQARTCYFFVLLFLAIYVYKPTKTVMGISHWFLFMFQ